MRIARSAALLILTAALALAGCGGHTPTAPSGPVAPAPVIPVITHGKVVIISIDGLRPDAGWCRHEVLSSDRGYESLSRFDERRFGERAAELFERRLPHSAGDGPHAGVSQHLSQIAD